MRPTARLGRAVSAALVGLALAVVAVPAFHPAFADDPTVNAVEGTTVTVNEPAIVGDYAADQGGPTFYPTPGTCTGVGCVNVPIHVPPPRIKGEETVVRLTISWVQTATPGDLESSDQLNFYVYHDPPTAKENSTGPLTFENSGTVDPVSLAIADPDSTAYYLVVSNSVGINNGFTLSVDYESGAFSAPTQPLGVTGGAGPSEGVQPSPSASAPVAPVAPPALGAGPVNAVTIPIGAGPPAAIGAPPAVVPLGDTGAFAGLDPGNVLAQINSASPNIFRRAVQATAPPRPPNDVLLWLWLVVVPLAVAGIGGAVLVRRRPAVLLGT